MLEKRKSIGREKTGRAGLLTGSTLLEKQIRLHAASIF